MSFDPNVFQAALLEVAEGTKAAATAAQAVQAAQVAQATQIAQMQSQAAGGSPSPSSSPTGATQSVDWSKLINKPPVLDGKTLEDGIRSYRDWNWQLIQYVNAIDTAYESELQQIMDDPTKPLEMTTASTETRQRFAKLYGLLASLCRNRSLNVVRSVKQADGFEALRQLTLILRPSTNNRGLALMAALTSWSPFNMQQSLQPQLLRLEEALEEAKRAGSTIPDQLQQAILLKCVSGQLRTHLNLAIEEKTTFSELRERVLRWDRSQQRWSSLVFAEGDGSQPMEIDRIYDWNDGGKKGGKGKGKGDQKGKGKGKNKGKSKDGKNGMKGKRKGSDGKGKYGGKTDASKGKGKSVQTCHKCGKPGDFARDCWSAVRNVQADGQNVGQPVTTQTGSPATSPGQSPQQGTPQHTQSTQYRVARIQFAQDVIGSDVEQHDDFIFDMRSPSSACGSVRVVNHYIGDEPNDVMREPYEIGAVRTMVEDIDDECSMQTILLDSGADASVFPAEMCELGTCSDAVMGNLRDAQGRKIPLYGMRDIEVHLMDIHAKSVTLRETVALSDQIAQPILCFGRLLEGGWSVNGVEQTLTHANGVAVPIELQNRSMTVKGWIRTIKERPSELSDLHLRAVSASVFEELTDARVGWKLNEHGVGTGKHYGNCFQDPTLACPSMSGRMFRSTLIQHGDKWLVMELCEPMEYLVDLSAEFHGYAGGRYIITIITDTERPPQVMGFRLLHDEDNEQRQDNNPPEEDIAIPLAPEDADEVIGIDIGGDAAEQAEQQQQGQDLEGQLVFVPYSCTSTGMFILQHFNFRFQG